MSTWFTSRGLKYNTQDDGSWQGEIKSHVKKSTKF